MGERAKLAVPMGLFALSAIFVAVSMIAIVDILQSWPEKAIAAPFAFIAVGFWGWLAVGTVRFIARLGK